MARRSRTPSGAAWPTFSLLRIMAVAILVLSFFFFSSRRRHTRCLSDWSSDVCSSDLQRLDGSFHGRGACVGRTMMLQFYIYRGIYLLGFCPSSRISSRGAAHDGLTRA